MKLMSSTNVRSWLAVDAPDAVVADALAVLLQSGGDVVDHHRVLLALVLGVGEQERKELLLDELGDGPVVGVGADRAGGDVGDDLVGALAGRAVDGDRVERVGLEAHAAVAVAVLVAELGVEVVEEQQVLALHVEDQRLGVDRLRAEHARVEEGVEEERGVGGLGRHARDAADVDVRAAGAVEELEVEVQRLVTMIDADGELGLHLVEVESLVALLALGAADRGARQRRHEDLGLDACGEDLGDLARLRGEDAVLDEEHVGVEASALVASLDLADDAGDRDGLVVGEVAGAHHDVVELEELALGERDGERERRGVGGADHAADLVQSLGPSTHRLRMSPEGAGRLIQTGWILSPSMRFLGARMAAGEVLPLEGLVLLLGPNGSGKTQLLEELASRDSW